MTSATYTWSETSSGHWERDIDPLERFYSSLSILFAPTGKTFFAITGHISLSLPSSDDSDHARDQSGRDFETALRAAWRRIRYLYPGTAAKVEWRHVLKGNELLPRKAYDILNSEDDVQKWLDESVIIVNNGQTADELIDAGLPCGKFATLTILSPPALNDVEGGGDLKRDIIFRCTHDCIDGVGTLILLDKLLELTTQYLSLDSPGSASAFPALGSETANLAPAFMAAASVPPPSAEQLVKLNAVMEFNVTVQDSPLNVLAPQPQNLTQAPGNSQDMLVEFSFDESKDILRRCKEFGISPTHAVHAGLVLTLRAVFPPQQEQSQEQSTGGGNAKTRYLSYLLQNLRQHCASPWSAQAAGIYHAAGGKPLVVDVNTFPSSSVQAKQDEFLGTATAIKAYYTEMTTDADYLPLLESYYAPIIPMVPDPLPVVAPKPSEGPGASLSSLGVLENFLRPTFTYSPGGDAWREKDGTIEVGNVWIGSDELQTGLGIYTDSLRGRLRVRAGWNEVYYEREVVRRLLGGVKGWVVEGLGVFGSHAARELQPRA